METSNSPGAAGRVLQALFILMAALVLVSVVYSGWVVLEYWGNVGV